MLLLRGACAGRDAGREDACEDTVDVDNLLLVLTSDSLEVSCCNRTRFCICSIEVGEMDLRFCGT